MNKTNNSQAGFGHIVLVFALVFLAVGGFAGYKVVSGRGSKADTAATVTATASSVPATITTQADLTLTSKALDNEAASVNGGLNDGSLDGDLNDML